MVGYTSAKAQIFSVDFLIACSIFLVAVTILFIYWSYTSLQIEETRRINDMIDKLYLASQVWFKEGTPTHWSAENIVELGLQNDDEFNQTKLSLLNNSIGYQKTLSLLGLNYNLYYRIYNEANATLFNFGFYPSNSKNVMVTKRVGILDGSIAIVEVVLWV